MKFDKVISAASVSWDFDVPTATEATFESLGKKETSIVELVATPNFNFGDACQPPTTKKKVDEFFVTLLPQVVAIVELDYTSISDDLLKRAAKYINAVSLLYIQYLSVKTALPTLNSMVPVLEHVRDVMFNFDQPSLVFARNNACKALELYVIQERHQSDSFLPVAMTGVLLSLSDDIAESLVLRAANIKRLYALRRFYAKIDWSDESAAWMCQEISRVALHASALKLPEGRKILAQLLTLDAGFTAALHTAAKPVIAAGKSGAIELLASVYYRSWCILTADQAATLSSAAVLQALERCVQELMDMAIYGANAAVAKACLLMLQLAFFDQKLENKLVDEMLTRLFAPLLWRALDASNPTVRINAASVLASAFPLQHAAEGDLATVEEQMQRQVTAFEVLLSDTDVNVRAHAVRCVCGVLARWWEIFVESATKRLASRVILECAADAASVAVRVAAVEGVTTMLSNPLSHTLMKVLLPRLGALIHDNADKVQLAVCELLLAVRRLRMLRFYEITPQEDLLLRLTATPNADIKDRITELLCATYFPLEKSNTELVERALVLIRDHPAAARAFYRSSHKHRPDAQLLKLACMLFKGVVFNAKRHRYLQLVESQERGAGGGSGEGSALQLQPVPAPPESMVLTPLQCRHALLTVCDLWLTALSYDTDAALRSFAEQFFHGNTLDFLLATYRDDAVVTSAVLTIASCLPASIAPGLVATVLELPHAERVVGALVRCVLKWDLFDATMHVAAVSIGQALIHHASRVASEVEQLLHSAGVEVELINADTSSSADAPTATMGKRGKSRSEARAAEPSPSAPELRLRRASPIGELSSSTALLLLTRLYANTAPLASVAGQTGLVGNGNGVMVLGLGNIALGIVEQDIGKKEIPVTLLDICESIGKMTVHALCHCADVLQDTDAVYRKYPRKSDLEQKKSGGANSRSTASDTVHAERVIGNARVGLGTAMQWLGQLLRVGTAAVDDLLCFAGMEAADARDVSSLALSLLPSTLARKRSYAAFLTRTTALCVDMLALGLAAKELPLPTLAAWLRALTGALHQLRVVAVSGGVDDHEGNTGSGTGANQGKSKSRKANNTTTTSSSSAASLPASLALSRLRALSTLTEDWMDALYRAMYWAVAHATTARTHVPVLYRARVDAEDVDVDESVTARARREMGVRAGPVWLTVGDSVSGEVEGDQFALGPSIALTMLHNACLLPRALHGVSSPSPRMCEAVAEACKLPRLRGHANALTALLASLLALAAADGAQAVVYGWDALLRDNGGNGSGRGSGGRKKARQGGTSGSAGDTTTDDDDDATGTTTATTAPAAGASMEGGDMGSVVIPVVPALVLTGASTDVGILPARAATLALPALPLCAGTLAQGAALAATADCSADKPPSIDGKPIFTEWESHVFRAIFRSATLTTVLSDVVIALIDGSIHELLHVPTRDDNTSSYAISQATTIAVCGAWHWTQYLSSTLPLSTSSSSSSSSFSCLSSLRVDPALVRAMLALGRSVLTAMPASKAKIALEAIFTDLEKRTEEIRAHPRRARVKEEP